MNKISRSERAFTMIEIAIAIGVIGFALVAIIGILPQGMNVQKDNREDTIISQDAPYFLNAIRNGEMRTNNNILANYVESIFVSNTVNSTYTNFINTNIVPVVPSGFTAIPASTDSNIIGLLSTPEYDPRDFTGNVMTTNVVTAIVRAMSGSAIQQNGANSLTAFRYQLTVENVPWNSISYDSTNFNFYNQNTPDYTNRYNRWLELAYLTNNLRELRLKFAWPVILLQNGNIASIGPGRQTYRSLISSHLGESSPYGLWFFQPQTYTTNIYSP
jgi:type II secretory pathway pseudopilin PulG